VLENGVIAKYVLGDPDAPWFGGSATVTTTFLKDARLKRTSPPTPRRWSSCAEPGGARKSLDGFTAIEEALAKEVPLSGFTLYNEFKPSDVEYFQKFFDVFTDRKIFTSGRRESLYTA
jgi:NitT/TauT family transport system substrate-binding protein